VEQSEAEALAARGFTVEQVKERQAELARMRALLFYEQQKRHRINKIKSTSPQI
jgi:U3 small nucleolar RNA-associated protein 14